MYDVLLVTSLPSQVKKNVTARLQARLQASTGRGLSSKVTLPCLEIFNCTVLRPQAWHKIVCWATLGYLGLDSRYSDFETKKTRASELRLQSGASEQKLRSIAGRPVWCGKLLCVERSPKVTSAAPPNCFETNLFCKKT